MYARVVRFTDVDPDHLAGRLADVEGREGPPVDIPAKGLEILHDPDQRTAVVIQLFETADDMAAAEGPPGRDGPRGNAGDARLDRPLRNQGRARPGVRRRTPSDARAARVLLRATSRVSALVVRRPAMR